MLLNTGNNNKKICFRNWISLCKKYSMKNDYYFYIFHFNLDCVYTSLSYWILYINIYFQNDSNTITLFTRFHVNWSTVYKKTWLNLNEFSFFMKITCVTCGWLDVLKIIFVKIAACFFLIFDYLWLIVNV